MQYSPYEVRQSDRLESHHGVRKVFVYSDNPKAGHDRTCLPWQYRFAGFTQAGLIIMASIIDKRQRPQRSLPQGLSTSHSSTSTNMRRARVTDVLQPTHR